MRPRGVCCSVWHRMSLSVMPAVTVPSVSTMPGLMELMRILRGPSSFASDLVTASTVNGVHHAIGAGLAGGVVDDHGGSLVRQMPGDRGADTLGGARHHRYLASQFLAVRAHDRVLSR